MLMSQDALREPLPRRAGTLSAGAGRRSSCCTRAQNEKPRWRGRPPGLVDRVQSERINQLPVATLPRNSFARRISEPPTVVAAHLGSECGYRQSI